MEKLKLYHYWRSSSSWRVRWALELKSIPYELTAVDLLTDESESPEHLKRNPMGQVPVLEFPGNKFLCESMAIIEWLEETYPTPTLLGEDLFARAWTRQLAEVINAGTQPLQNPNVAALHTADPDGQKRWNMHWIQRGLDSYEKLVASTAGIYSVGDRITLADLYLIPQCYNATRFGVLLKQFPILSRINDAALETKACQATSPERYKP